MPPLIVTKILPAALAFIASASLVFVWQTKLPDHSVPLRVPATGDNGGDDTTGPSPLASATLTKGGGSPSDLPGSWPCFRGPNRDGISPESVPLADSWPTDGPPALWSVEAGEGYAGAAVHNGRVYLMDYDRENSADALRCLSLADGKEIWRLSYPLSVKRNHGMSRTVPAVNDQIVVALGPKCHVSCLDPATGELRWSLDLVRDHGTEVPAWYAGQCPLIDGDRVIIAPAGEQLMLALDATTGKPVWKTPNPRAWKMTHVSIVPATIGGRPSYLYCGHRGVAGVATDDGSLLWDTDAWKISIATVSSPVPMPGDQIFLSGGYKAGSMMLQINHQDEKWSTETVFRLDQDTFGATQQTPVLHDGYLYGVRPNGELACLDPTGKVRWTSGMSHRFGLGPFIIADGKILVLDDDGNLTMAAATPDEFRPLAQAKVLSGHDCWGPLAIAGGHLIARDLTTLVCLDLRKK